MDIKFILIQILWFVAWLFLLFSYYRKNTKKILVFQIIGNVLFIIHYFLLNAFSGFIICVCDMLFDTSYYKTKKPVVMYVISIPVRIICGIIFFNTWLDILPIVASLIEGYSLTKEKKYVVIGAIIAYIIWLIYDLCVLSFAGAISDGIIIISNTLIILRLRDNK